MVPIGKQMEKEIKTFEDDNEAHFKNLTDTVFKGKKQKVLDARDEEKRMKKQIQQ